MVRKNISFTDYFSRFSLSVIGALTFLFLTIGFSYAEQVVATNVSNLDVKSPTGKGLDVTIQTQSPSGGAQSKTLPAQTFKTTIAPKNTGGVVTMSLCGDNICDAANGENSGNCNADCIDTCGDDRCSSQETCYTPASGGNPASGCLDCGTCSCGNTVCDTSKGEDCGNCPADCGSCCHVANQICEGNRGETCVTCQSDCGSCCGQLGCQADIGETCSTCLQDCGACPPVCPNGICEVGETTASCPGDCPAPSCFLAGTPITMSDGSLKSIENIKVGDHVLAFDNETSQFKPDKVTKVFKHVSNGYLLINGHLKVTGNHPVFTGEKWTQIGKLNVGDQLLNEKGEIEAIISKEKVSGKIKTYNIEVNPFHTYIAGGYVVHNGTGGGGTGKEEPPPGGEL